MKQTTLGSTDWALKTKVARRARFFAGIDRITEVVPDKTSIPRFRHLPERHRLTEKLFPEVRQLLEERKLLLRPGTLVDATIIAAPPLTKNAVRALTLFALSNLYLA